MISHNHAGNSHTFLTLRIMSIYNASHTFSLSPPIFNTLGHFPTILLLQVLDLHLSPAGLTLNFGILISWQDIVGTLSPACLTLYGSAALWTIIYDSVYSHQVNTCTQIPSRPCTNAYTGVRASTSTFHYPRSLSSFEFSPRFQSVLLTTYLFSHWFLLFRTRLLFYKPFVLFESYVFLRTFFFSFAFRFRYCTNSITIYRIILFVTIHEYTYSR